MNDVLRLVCEYEAGRLERGPRRTAAQARADASSPWLTEPDARALSKSRQTSVLMGLVGNPHTPLDVVTRLAERGSADVVKAACRTRRLTWAVAGPLLRDAGVPPQFSPHCPPEVLTEQRARAHGIHQDVVLSHPNLPDAIIEEVLSGDLADLRARGGMLKVCKSPALTQARFDALYDGAPTRRRSMLGWVWAENPSASSRWLAHAVQDHAGNAGIIARVAANPNTDAATLHELALMPVDRATPLANPSCGPATLTEVAQLFATYWGRSEQAQAAIAHHPMAPLDALATMRPAVADPATFVLAHSRSAAQAQVMLELMPRWELSLADLVATTAVGTAA